MGYNSCHIEKLPEDILLRILQSLPLVDAVATAPVSRRWKNLWERSCPQHLNLCFDVDNLIGGGKPAWEYHKESQDLNYRKNLKLRDGVYREMSSQIIEDFIKGVNMIVQHRRGEEQGDLLGVNSLEIRFPLRGMHSNHIDNWISSTISSATKQLILVFHIQSDLPSLYRESEFYQFPFEVLLNQKNLSLEYLQLEFISTKLPQNFDGFTTLRTLKLNRTNLTEEDAHKLLTNCPLLEFLKIESCRKLAALQVSCPLPHLKFLVLIGCYELRSIELWAENLSSFEYNSADSIDHLMLRGCHNLTKVAAFGLYNIDGDYFRSLSDGFPFVSTLYLDVNLKDLKVVLRPNLFAHLKFLALFLEVEKNERNLEYLSSLLNVVAPMLEELTLHIQRYGSGKQFKTNNRRIDGNLYNHLKRVAFTGFTGETGQTMLAKHFLTKARRLQTMTIDPLTRYYKDFDAVEHYRRYPREIDDKCRNAYKFLCKEVPESAKLIMVGN